jgi:hypothetical protein
MSLTDMDLLCYRDLAVPKNLWPSLVLLVIAVRGVSDLRLVLVGKAVN